MTAADHPSVTDNARAERQRSEYTVQETAAYFAGRVQRLADRMREDDYRRSMTDVVALGSVQAFLDRIARDDLDVYAAGRAETTTATDEDALAIRDRLLSDALAYIEREGLSLKGAVQAALRMGAEAGLLATSRTVRVHPTYTVEYQQKIADELGVKREEVLRALGLAAPLLVTARTRPTREDVEGAVAGVLFNAMNHPDPVAVLGKSTTTLRVKITDAVMRAIARTEADR